MAKKKTENIKAAPVLRAQSGGNEPTPETPVITKSYSVRDDWKDKDIVNYVAFKSVDGEVQDLTVNGEPAGGGGGVGVQAKVSFNVKVTEGKTLNITYRELGTSGAATGSLYGAHFDPSRHKYYANNPTIPYTDSVTYEESFIIISPTFAISVSNGDITAVSGNADWSEGDSAVRNITGNCTITISA